MRHKLLIPLTVAAAAGAVVLFSGVLRESSSAGASALPAERVAATFEPSYSSAQDAATLVLRLQEHLRDHPTDGDSYALLGLAYQQRARETGDPAVLPEVRGGSRSRAHSEQPRSNRALRARVARAHAPSILPRACPGAAGAHACAVNGAELRSDRRRAPRARSLRRGLRCLRHDGAAQAERRRVRARLVRT